MRYDTEFYVPADGWDSQGKRLARYCSGGGGGQQQASTTTQVNYSPEEAAARAKVQAEAERIYGATAGTIAGSPYPGSKPVPFSPETLAAQSGLMNFATGAGQQQAAQAGGYSSFLMGPAQYAESNPYLQSAMSSAIRPVTEAYTDPGGVFSQIRSNAINTGTYGSSRQAIAEGIAGRGYLSTIGDITGKMANENYQNAQRYGAQALALSPQTFQLGTQPALSAAAVGQQKEAVAQAGEDYAANSRMWSLNAPWTPLQNYANIVFGGATPGTTSTSTGMGGGGQSTFARALGGAATGAAMGSFFPGFGSVIGGGIGLLAGLLG